jgi:hypothetical protein
MKQAAPLTLPAAQQQALAAAAARLEGARRDSGLSLHRSLTHLRLRPRDLLETLVIGLVLTALVWWSKPELLQLWEDLIGWWAQALRLPLVLSDDGVRLEWTLLAEAGSLVPGPLTGVLTAAGVMGVFAATFWMGDRWVPLKYLLRTLCVIQASALLFFMAVPSRFPYTIGGHLSAMLQSGYYLMLAIPALLALGYGVLRVPLWQKFALPAALLAYFTAMLPHKVLLHALVLQHLSALFMPLLYLCFGLVFDVMVFVALYAWAVSHAPARALG